MYIYLRLNRYQIGLCWLLYEVKVQSIQICSFYIPFYVCTCLELSSYSRKVI